MAAAGGQRSCPAGAALRRPPPARPPPAPAPPPSDSAAAAQSAAEAGAGGGGSLSSVSPSWELRLRTDPRGDSARSRPQRRRGRQARGPSSPQDEETEAQRTVIYPPARNLVIAVH